VRSRFVPERPESVRFPAMFQGWDQMTFLHWPCDAGPLQARLPGGLTIDTYEETAWIGLTPFHLTGLRPPFLPAIRGLSDFPETNLRTYVRGPAGPGIWFFSLDAASLLAVFGARLSYGLPYHWATMRVSIAGRRMHYESARAGAAASITVEIGEPLPDPDDLTLFLTERYRLYTRVLGLLAMAPVEHEPWPLHRARLVDLKETVRRAAGLPDGDRPALVHWSPGVGVRVGLPRWPPRGPGEIVMARTEALTLLNEDHEKVRKVLDART
jgi:uncharacterized protein YqjF (DUF2071 family)